MKGQIGSRNPGNFNNLIFITVGLKKKKKKINNTEMALVFSKCTATPLSSSHPSLPIFSVSAFDSPTRSHNKALGFNRKLFNEPQAQTPFKLKKGYKLIVKSSSENFDVGPVLEPPSDNEDEDIAGFEDFPMDAKLQLKLEHKLKLKLSKKIRLRGKKLVRKRRMRKKGQWPPSKMKNNKNV